MLRSFLVSICFRSSFVLSSHSKNDTEATRQPILRKSRDLDCVEPFKTNSFVAASRRK